MRRRSCLQLRKGKTMKIKTWIKYETSYIPPRKRKPVYEEREEYVYIELREVFKKDMSLAFEDNSYGGKGCIFFYDGCLWCKAKLPNVSIMDDLQERGHDIKTALDYLVYCNENCSTYFRFDYDRTHHGMDTSREAVIAAAENKMQSYILVDGELYKKTAEPRYTIYTFGLGWNHGGTALSVDYWYNPNISRNAYFSAADGEKAVQEAICTAEARGDTESVQHITADIVVHRPDLVTLDPQREHGEGNALLNEMESLARGAGDPLTAALLVMATT